MDSEGDVDVASLVVALMSPFEDRIAALENEVVELKARICDCATLSDFQELKSSVEGVITRQKARSAQKRSRS